MNRGFIYFICFVILQCFLYNITAKSGFTAKNGPYMTIAVRTEKCNSTHHPLMKVPLAVFQAELYNTTTGINLLNGNVTILRDNKYYMIDYKGYLWENDRWQVFFLANNISCRTLIVSLALPYMGVKFNKKTCSAPMGLYKFENIDYNNIDHIWAQSRYYGRVLWRLEVHNKKEAVVCWETETVVTPV